MCLLMSVLSQKFFVTCLPMLQTQCEFCGRYIFTTILIITDSLIFMPETPNFTGFFLSEIFRNRKNQTGQERTFTTPKRTQNF